MEKNKFKIAIAISLVLALVSGICGFMISRNISKKNEPVINAQYVSGRIEGISELNTAELIYSGLVTFEEGKIPFLTQTGFTMFYTAVAKAGIEFDKIAIEVSDTQVKLILPEAKLISVHVDPESIQFFDEKQALLNWSQKEDVTAAIALAENDFKEDAGLSDLLARAQSQAEFLIRGILADSIGSRELVISER